MKEKIIEVSLERFLQFGIRSMTIKKLVEPLGISTKTVYKYFGSKEELLAECLKVLYAGYHNEFVVKMNQKDSPVFKLLSLFYSSMGKDFGVTRAFFHDLNYYYPELQNAELNKIGRDYGDVLTPTIQSGIDEGYFNKYINAEVVLKGIGTLYALITRSEEYKNYKGSPYTLFENLVEVYIRGMCSEKGIKEIENKPYKHE